MKPEVALPRRPLALRLAAFLLAMGLLLALSAPTVARAATISDVSGKIICQCGCGAVLDQCPHQDCGWGVPAKEFIKDQMAAGKTPDELLRYYVSQYGQKVLASPTKTGFNITAWVTPFAVLIAGGLGIYYLVRMWAQQSELLEPAAPQGPGRPEHLVKTFEDELRRFD